MADKTFNMMTQLSLNSEDFKAGIERVKGNVKDLILGVEGANGNIREMRQALMALRSVSFAGKSVEEIKAINQQIGKLTDDMGDLKKMQTAMGTEFGAVFAKGLQGVTAMGEIVIGVASAFGASEESAKKYQQVMVQLIGVSQAFATIQSLIEERTLQIIALKVRDTVVTAAQTVATWAATVATWAWNAGLLVTVGLIGGIIIAVAAVAAGIYYLINAHDKETKALEDKKKANDKLVGDAKAIDEANARAEKSAKLNRRLEELRGATVEQIGNMEIAGLEMKLNMQQEVINRANETIRLYGPTITAVDTLKKAEQDLADTMVEIEIKKKEVAKAVEEEAKKKAEQYAKENKGLEGLNFQLSKQKKLIEDIVAEGGMISPENLDKYTKLELKLEKVNDRLKDIIESSYIIAKFGTAVENKINLGSEMLSGPGRAAMLGQGVKTTAQYKLDKEGKGESEFKLETGPNLTWVKNLTKAKEELDKLKEKIIAFKDAVVNGFEQIGLAIGGSLLKSLEESSRGIERFLGGMLKAVIKLISMYLGQALAASIAGATESGAATGPAAIFTTPAFIATAVGGVLAAFAAIPKFAFGGIIPGSSYGGDRTLVAANAGEMILSTGQQTSLFNMINRPTSMTNGEVVFRIGGTELVGVLSNHNRKINSIR